MNKCRFSYMRLFIILPICYAVLVSSAPKQSTEEDLPFSTDNFHTFLEDKNSNSAEEKDELALSYSDQAETLKKRLKMKSMFNTNGPPAVGSDLFSSVAVEENVKKLSYEGSGSAVEENSEQSEEIITTSTMVSAELTYDADNSTIDEAIESSSNSSILYDQNTSDAEVETVSDTVYQKNEASAILQASQIESDNEAEETDDEEEEKGTISPATIENVDYAGNETSSKVVCPPPRMCKKNCFVTINENGCQDCQCLWVAADCQVDSDCVEKNQYCDLGKCNCQPGYQQNMRKSGVCEVVPPATQEATAISESVDIVDNRTEEAAERVKKLTKRSKRESKPRRSERLEWPGVCDKNEHCPENLVCIHGDCWSIPEKSKREDEVPQTPKVIISRNTDETRKVSFDTDELMEPTTKTSSSSATTHFVRDPLPTTLPSTEAPRRGMSRFVSDDFAKQLRRTTAKVKKYDWFPPTTTVAPSITQLALTTNHMPPLTVDQFFMIETTASPTTTVHHKIFNDHKLEYMKERKPNFLGVKEEVTDFDYPMASQSHIKKIHLEVPPIPTLLPHRKKHKKIRTTTSTPDDASEVEEKSRVDEIEFPISSKIGLGSHKPRALSAEPTREELKDHKSLVDLFNSHAIKAQELEETSIKPSFQILQSFGGPDPEPVPDLQVPDIDVSLTNAPGTTFLPIPDLLSGDITVPPATKPYIIRNRKFTTIASLSNISGDMASDDPPEVTPEPAPFEQHQMGVWYPMKKGDIPHMGVFSGEFRRAPRRNLKTADDLRLYNEYTKANRQNRPVRIEMDNASGLVRNECRENKNCGTKNICCTKKWCDRTDNCGIGRFCLPNCDSTKLTFLPSTNHAESVIDIMYD